MTPAYKYWAFINYTHQDKAWADWLHERLETYRIPNRLVGCERRSPAEIAARLQCRSPWRLSEESLLPDLDLARRCRASQ